ncbi:MAG: MBL fold metallo-hydrolase [Elusimicrobia bacterium]|nr:MBL fold metallo-hydrolase [Elusimicrobiota bacterium]
MQIKLWGCRGSIASPGPATLRYGGNTTCLEMRTKKGRIVIVDAGSGLRFLGKALRREPGVSELRFFITHAHLDHLSGFPFFEPAYLERFSLTFCGGVHAQDSIKRYLSRQMTAPFFPVEFSVLKAKFDFACQRDGMRPCSGPCRWDGLEVAPIALNHPNGGYGFKFTERGRSFVFLTDNELGFRHEGGLTPAQYADLCRGADLLIHDAQYTDAEYRLTRGWGHSTFNDAVDLALAAGVKRLGLFHHDPDRTDDDLDRQVENCRRRIRKAGGAVDCFGATEGTTLEP